MIPKSVLQMKYSKDISVSDKATLINGLRSIIAAEGLKNALVVDVQEILKGLTGMDNSFTMIVSVIGLIALTITFFLLLVSTTHNIKDNIWEYGVLRSMGVTKAQGRRIYMYEAFLVVVAAGILGCMIGLVVSCLVTIQFNVFLEQPFVLNFPGYFVGGLVFVALTTTWFAVYFPVQSVNNSTIAKVLKSGA